MNITLSNVLPLSLHVKHLSSNNNLSIGADDADTVRKCLVVEKVLIKHLENTVWPEMFVSG